MREAAIISGVMNAKPVNDARFSRKYAAERESTQGIEDVEPLGFSSRTRRGGLGAHLHGGIIGRAGGVG